MDFKTKFKKLRKSIGCNQAEFGIAMGLTQQSVSQIESGKTNPSKTLIAYLDYRYTDFFDGKRSTVDMPFNDHATGKKLIEQLARIESLDSQLFEIAIKQIEAIHTIAVAREQENVSSEDNLKTG